MQASDPYLPCLSLPYLFLNSAPHHPHAAHTATKEMGCWALACLAACGGKVAAKIAEKDGTSIDILPFLGGVPCTDGGHKICRLSDKG